jgi:hypothetical protein
MKNMTTKSLDWVDVIETADEQTPYHRITLPFQAKPSLSGSMRTGFVVST